MLVLLFLFRHGSASLLNLIPVLVVLGIGIAVLIVCMLPSVDWLSRCKIVCLEVLILVAVWLCSGVALESTPWFGLPSDSVSSIVGTLVADTGFSKTGRGICWLDLDNCKDRVQRSSDARGWICIIGDDLGFIPRGSIVKVDGTVVKVEQGKSWFSANSIQVLPSASGMGQLIRGARLGIIKCISWKLHLLEPSSVQLVELLVLGNSDSPEPHWRDLALASGCLHVLALSGMHLSALASIAGCIASPVLGKKRAKFIGALAASLFLWIAGPKASLVRAYIFMGLGWLPLRNTPPQLKLATCFVLHLCIDPFGVSSIASLLSYGALTGILACSDILEGIYGKYLPPVVVSLISPGCCALLVVAPVTIALQGTWNPAGILLSPVSSCLAIMVMSTGLLWLVVPIPILGHIVNVLVRMLEYVFSMGAMVASRYPRLCTGRACIIGIVVLLTVSVIVGYAGQSGCRRSIARYGLDISLRFPECDQCNP